MKGQHHTTNNTLEGIRIIDLSMGWAGPLACRHMADMGADVIKVESCERFDWWRSWEATPEWIAANGAEKSTAFNMVNRNKRDITLDLEHPEGRQLLLDLVGKAHCVVENYSGSVLPKLNLSYEVFRAVNPAIVLLSMPAFGSTGPWAEFRAYGSTVEQSSGLPHLNGFAEDPPTMEHIALGDAVGGLNGAAALLVALRHQARTGEGQFVDLSQVEGLFPLAAHGLLEYAATGAAPQRLGNHGAGYAPHGTYRCTGDDQWLCIEAVDETQWLALQKLTDGALDGFGDNANRLQRQPELDDAINAWTADQDAETLAAALQQAGVPACATQSVATLLHHPHMAARGFWQYLERDFVGQQPHPSPPYRIGAAPLPVATPAPTLGQHNAEVLGELLGLDVDALQRLTDLGVIGDKPRMPRKKSQDG